ncbi:MAG TPA: energy-coupling factor transporter transmembrane component T [bacterium]|nr:energy-coupling factor transporter transmembrane component T [bacterium]
MLRHNAFSYKFKNTIVHKLNAILKLLFLLAIIISNIFHHNFLVLIILFALLLILYFIADFTIIDFFKDLKFVFYLFLFGALLWLIYRYASIIYLIEIFLKMLVFFTAFSLFFRTTNLQQFIFYFRKILPFKIIMICAVSIRFIPIFAAELSNIIELQKRRGVKFNLKNLVFGRTILAIIIPLIIRTLKIAEELTNYAYIKKFGAVKNRTYIYDSAKIKDYFNQKN